MKLPLLWVIDASVFNKLFLDEHDSFQAKRLFKYALEQDILLLAPHILFYESLQSSLHFGVPFDIFSEFLQVQRNAGMQLIEPSLEVLKIAKKITSTGNKQSGYPHLIDSIYHAVAIVEKGVFITADKKYYTKAMGFEHIELLSGIKI